MVHSRSGFGAEATGVSLWVRRDAGVLRTICDGWDGCTWGVYSGAHTGYRVNPAQPLDAAIADIVLTRGDEPIDEATFAGAVERGAPAEDRFVVGKYRDLALSETPNVRVAACAQLWIAAHDPEWREAAGNAMRQARCDCSATSSGKVDCGPTIGINGDPPF